MNAIVFGNVTFPCGPKALKIARGRRVVTRYSPFRGEIVEDCGPLAVRVSGEGELFGADAEEELEALAAAFEAGDPALLRVGTLSFPAVFETFAVVRSEETGVIRIEFAFRELPAA